MINENETKNEKNLKNKIANYELLREGLLAEVHCSPQEQQKLHDPEEYQLKAIEFE